VIVVTLARKPIPSSVARNMLDHGCGGLNIDRCRIQSTGDEPNAGAHKQGATTPGFEGGFGPQPRGWDGSSGRWPANLILQHQPGCFPVGQRTVQGSGSVTGHEPSAALQLFGGVARSDFRAYGNGNGTETVTAWSCESGCPVADMDSQSGVSVSIRSAGRNGKDNPVATFGLQRKDDNARGHDDTGTASRFFKQIR
jgi:hypothetical protein